jgi:hypothetical protein
MISDVSLLAVAGSFLVATTAGVAGICALGRGASTATDRLFAPSIPLLVIGSVLFVVGVWSTGANGLGAIVARTSVTWGAIIVSVVILQFLRHSGTNHGIDGWKPGPDGYDAVA